MALGIALMSFTELGIAMLARLLGIALDCRPDARRTGGRLRRRLMSGRRRRRAAVLGAIRAVQGAHEGTTAPHVAVRSRNPSLVRYLLDKGARTDSKDASGRAAQS